MFFHCFHGSSFLPISIYSLYCSSACLFLQLLLMLLYCFSISSPFRLTHSKFCYSSQASTAAPRTAHVTCCWKSIRGSTPPLSSSTICAVMTAIFSSRILVPVLTKSTTWIETGIRRLRRLVECRSSPTIWSDSCRSHGIASASSIATSFSLQTSIVL